MRLTAVNAGKDFIRKRKDSNILHAVSGISLALEPGTLTALSGPSGSGKSTLLNMFAGLLPPTTGQILLDDTDLYSLDDKKLSMLRNRHLGVIPQGQTALQALTVLENIMVPYQLCGSRKKEKTGELKERAQQLMVRADIRELENEMPSELSGGELRRMAVIRAMLMSPEIVLADEPTGDLDEENTAIVMELLKSHARSGGTVFMVTHDKQAREYADQLLEMRKGIIS